MENGKFGLSFADDVGPLAQSYTDIRRLAAENAARRLQALMVKQCAQNSSQSYGDWVRLDDETVRQVSVIWDYVVKYQDVLAAKIAKRVCHVIKGRNQDVNNAVRLDKCQTDSMKRFYRSQDAVHCGRCLIGHITDIVGSLRRGSGLRKVLKSKIRSLIAAGYSKDYITRGCHSLTSVLCEHLPSQWSAQRERAWGTALDYLLNVGSKLWEKIAEKKKKSSGGNNFFTDLPPLAKGRREKRLRPFRP
ncbi:hypothetical protein Btru_066574 [Bulinus truncatus]|nr:hypothetical protein Btru_066574 [Bulinus truncatus]